MPPGNDVVLEPVPRTDDLRRGAEAQPEALAVFPEHFLDLAKDFSLADRAAGVRAAVLPGVDLVALPEHAELERSDLEHAVIAVGDLRELAHQHFIHRAVSENSGSGRRYHIATSNGFRSAARISSQIASTASVAVIAFFSINGAADPLLSTCAA